MPQPGSFLGRAGCLILGEMVVPVLGRTTSLDGQHTSSVDSSKPHGRGLRPLAARALRGGHTVRGTQEPGDLTPPTFAVHGSPLDCSALVAVKQRTAKDIAT